MPRQGESRKKDAEKWDMPTSDKCQQCRLHGDKCAVLFFDITSIRGKKIAKKISDEDPEFSIPAIRPTNVMPYRIWLDNLYHFMPELGIIPIDIESLAATLKPNTHLLLLINDKSVKAGKYKCLHSKK